MKLTTFGLTVLLALSAFPATAGSFTFSGTFASDDDLVSIGFTLANSGGVILRTAGYGGIANTYASGGFDPVLSLFDTSGLLIGLNEDGGCGLVSADPVTGNCWDSYLSVPLPAGTYLLVLTQEDNLPFGPTFLDGFSRAGQGNFTPGLTGIPGKQFLDLSPSQRDGGWIVLVSGVDSAAVPEPASLRLVGEAMLLMLVPLGRQMERLFCSHTSRAGLRTFGRRRRTVVRRES